LPVARLLYMLLLRSFIVAVASEEIYSVGESKPGERQVIVYGEREKSLVVALRFVRLKRLAYSQRDD